MLALCPPFPAQAETNFPVDKYADLLSCMHAIELEELVMSVRRQSQVRALPACGLLSVCLSLPGCQD